MSDEVEKKTNVLRLPLRDPQAQPLFVVEKREPVCFPHAFLINGEKRTVTCRRCKVPFDPITALLYISREWDHFHHNANDLKAQIQRLTDERDEIRRDVQNLKAQRKRAGTTTR